MRYFLGVITNFPVLKDGQLVEISLESFRSSSRDLVGLQLWRGAFVLAEYILHSEIKGQNVLELAAGTGFTSLVAALSAKNVICTDIDHGNILPLIRSNFEYNSKVTKANCQVTELDFFKDDWKIKLAKDIKNTQLVIAADVIYNEEITRAFFQTLEYLMDHVTHNLRILIALEKRLWTDEGGGIVAPSYAVFKQCLEDLQSKKSIQVDQKPLNFPHIFSQFYDRVDNLVLWEINSF